MKRSRLEFRISEAHKIKLKEYCKVFGVSLTEQIEGWIESLPDPKNIDIVYVQSKDFSDENR